LVNKLVFENLRHRPVRTLLSTVAIGVQVTMILTLVGVSRGMLGELQQRQRGINADISVRAPGSQIIGYSTNFSDKYLPLIRQQPHVKAVAGTLIQPVGGINSMTGIDYNEFVAVSGGFEFLEGGPFKSPDDIIIDDVYSRPKKLHAGDKVEVLNKNWRVAGIVRAGKLSHMFAQIHVLQELFANDHKVTVAYVKLDNPANTQPVIEQLSAKLADFKIYSMEELVSLISVDNVPMLKPFIGVIVTLGALIGFLVVFLSMYTAVLERTREIGILKALGASPGYVMSILLRETAMLAVVGAIAGILMTFGTKWLIETFVPEMDQAIVPDWWPIAAAIAIVGALLGAAYPGMKAARQDPIEALSYD
jgi:putative ABC transport system permease protein